MKLIILENFIGSLKVLVSTNGPSGMTIGKMGAAVKVSMFLAPVTMVTGVMNWVDANIAYIDLVMMAIFFDWFLGTIKHALWIKDFDWKLNIKGIIVKTMLIIIVGAVFEGLRHLTIEYTSITSYIVSILRLTVFLYPATSIIRSARVVSDGKFPPKGIYDAIENWSKDIVKKKT